MKTFLMQIDSPQTATDIARRLAGRGVQSHVLKGKEDAPRQVFMSIADGGWTAEDLGREFAKCNLRITSTTPFGKGGRPLTDAQSHLLSSEGERTNSIPIHGVTFLNLAHAEPEPQPRQVDTFHHVPSAPAAPIQLSAADVQKQSDAKQIQAGEKMAAKILRDAAIKRGEDVEDEAMPVGMSDGERQGWIQGQKYLKERLATMKQVEAANAR